MRRSAPTRPSIRRSPNCAATAPRSMSRRRSGPCWPAARFGPPMSIARGSRTPTRCAASRRSWAPASPCCARPGPCSRSRRLRRPTTRWSCRNAAKSSPAVIFHAEPVAFAADQIALAVCETGALAERRIALLVDPAMSELPAFLTPEPGVNSGFMAAEITAAALAAENRQRATPASIDSLTTCANQEDHVSMATHGARRLLEMTDNLAKILANRMARRRPGHRVPQAAADEPPPGRGGRKAARRRAAARRRPLHGAGHRSRRRPCPGRRARRGGRSGRHARLVTGARRQKR